MSFCDLRFRCAAVLLLVCVSVFSDEASIADKLRTIRITRMEFIEAPPEVCLEYIRRGVLRTGQVERLNFIYCFHQDDLNPTTVSLEVRNQSVKTALDGICTKANLRMVLAGHTIAFYPRNYQKRKIFTLSDDPNSQILYKEMNKKIVDVRYFRKDSQSAFINMVENFLKQTDTNIEVPLAFHGDFPFVTLYAKGLSVKHLLEFLGECAGWTFKIDGFKIIASVTSSPLQYSTWPGNAGDFF